MLSLQVLVPPHHDQTVKVNQRDVVGNMRIYIHDKQEEVPVSSLSNKRLFLRHPSGAGVWLDNSNVFSSYFISPNKDVLELRTVAAPPLQPSFTHRSCLKLIIPYYDYAAVFSDFLECPHTITVEAIKKALAALTLFNIADSDDTQLWYFWPQDHTLNQLPNPKTPIPSSPSSPALTYHQTYHTHAQQRRSNSISSRSTSLPSSNSFPSISTSNSLASLGSSALSLSSSNLPTCTQLIPIPALTHPLQATPPQVNYIHIPKEPVFRDVEFEVDRPSDNCEECKKEQERREEEDKKRKADEALRRVLYTPHTHLEFCVVWTPRVALLKSIKRRIVKKDIVDSPKVYKTLIFQHRTTVQDALQILTEFVQYAHQRTSEAGGDPEHQLNRPSDPTQKRYALFKDGARLEEDKLLAELLDPQVLWTRVVCTFMEIGAVPKKHTATQITSPMRSSLDEVGSRPNNPDVPDSDDCHLLILYRKQQAFRNFHFNPAISVGRAIKIISGGFNIPATTINQDDWSFRLRRNSSNGLRVTGDGETEGSGSSTSTPTGTPSSGGNTPADSSLSIVINNSNNNNNNGDIGSSPSNNNSVSLPSTPASPAPISPKPSFPFSLFGGGKNASMLELSPVSSPVLSLMNTLSLDGNSPVSAASSAPAMSPPVNTSRVTPRTLSISTMGGDLDNRHEYMLYDFHRHEWLDNDRTLASYKFHTKYTNFSGRSVAAASSSLPHITLSESVPVELQLRPRPRMRRMALIDGVDFTIPLDANANAVLVYSPTTTVAAAIDEVQTLSGIREPSLELFVRYNFTTSPQSPSTSPAFGAPSPMANSPTSPSISSNVNSRVPFLSGGTGGSNGSYNKLYVERVCLEFGKTLWSYNFLPTSTLEIFVEDEEKRDTEVLEEHALKAFGGHSTSFLPGEFTQHTRDHVTHFEERVGGECAAGRLIITNYRLIFHSQNRSSYKELASDDIDVPLCTIDKVKPLQFSGGNQTTTGIDLTCKDMRNIMFGWRSDGGKNLANLLKKLIPSRQEDFFAFASKENFSTLGWDIYDAESEYKRIGMTGSANFRLTRINREYTLCPTYPSVFVVPASITDDMLTRVASFREKGRIPAVSWLHPNGASITRCSQPRVGIGRARCVDDEMLLKALSSGSKTLYLIDSRPMANAMYNTLAGRGFETAELFLGIGNIHVMRESFKKLVDLCLSRSTDDEGTHWLSALESTNWMEHARVILKSASLIVDIVEKKSCSVVTHCSDGWDRTSQIVALAELLLDPYFRSIRGFEILLEKEWLSFARSGNWLEAGASKDNEFAPIFLLFLDAVYKVMMQYPTAFEFNENFLLTIADSVYNCRFGTFLYNSEKERMDMNLKSRTVSLWALYIASNKRNFTNPHFNPQSQQRVLFPSIRYPKLSFWSGYYLRFVKSFMRSSDSVDARTWQLIDENAALKAHIEKLQAGVIP